MRPLASSPSGKAGRIMGPPGLSVHLDSILKVNRGPEWRRTETAVELGAPLTVHRMRVPEVVTMNIAISNVEPRAGALLLGLWELGHVEKTKLKLEQAQAAPTELMVWTGTSFLRTPAGIQVWVLDKVDYDDEPGFDGSLRATLTFGENPRFATMFTPALPAADPGLTDVVGGTAERGLQSTTTAGADAASEVAAGAWP